jgi:hypothetical protein
MKSKEEGYWFGLGSFKFRNFKDLHKNIRGRTGSFNRPCSIIKDGKGIFTFPLKYERKIGGREKFVLEWEPVVMESFRADSILNSDLGPYLPKFQRIGCTATGSMTKAKWYGVLKLGR